MMRDRIWVSLAVLALSAVLAACGSRVKLDESPAASPPTSASQTAAQPSTGAAAQAGAQSSGTVNRDVSPVNADPAAQSTAGPPNVGRVIYFDYDSFAIKPEFQALIDAHARFIAANPNRRITIEGHTDERGGREYNLALGQKRSEAVQGALRLLGVRDNQSEPVSFGKEKPVAAGSNEEAWSRNRRAEIVYR